MSDHVSLYEAKTHLSSLVDRAAAGEEIVITKNGKARARLTPLPQSPERRTPQNALQIVWISDDFDAPDPELEALFYDGDIEPQTHED